MNKTHERSALRMVVRHGIVLAMLIAIPLWLSMRLTLAAPQDGYRSDPRSEFFAPTPSSQDPATNQRPSTPRVGQYGIRHPSTNSRSDDYYAKQTPIPYIEQVTRTIPVQVSHPYKDPQTGETKTKTITQFRNETYNVTRYRYETNNTNVPHFERVRELATEIAASGTVFLPEKAEEERSKKKEELKKLLGEQFDAMHQDQQKQIDQLAKRLKRLQDAQSARKEAKDKIVERRMLTLTQQPDPYAWNPLPGNQTPVSRAHSFPTTGSPIELPGPPTRSSHTIPTPQDYRTPTLPRNAVAPIQLPPYEPVQSDINRPTVQKRPRTEDNLFNEDTYEDSSEEAEDSSEDLLGL